jgi:GNAT superfamily N-acetyltransferase
MSIGVIIRAVEPADFDQWCRLWDGYNCFYGRPEFPPEITRITWSRFFNAAEPVHALVAERNSELLGLAHYLFHRSTIMIEPTCYLQDLFTTGPARGCGVGRSLIESVYQRAKAAGSERVYWQTHERNQTAIGLYDKVAERSGFIVYRKQL